MDAAFPYAPHAFTTSAAAIQAVVRAQVRGRSANHLRSHLRLPTVLCRSQYALPFGLFRGDGHSSGERRVWRQICGRYDMTRTLLVKTRLIMSLRPVDFSVGIPRMSLHVRNPRQAELLQATPLYSHRPCRTWILTEGPYVAPSRGVRVLREGEEELGKSNGKSSGNCYQVADDQPSRVTSCKALSSP